MCGRKRRPGALPLNQQLDAENMELMGSAWKAWFVLPCFALLIVVSACSYNAPLAAETVRQHFSFLRDDQTTRDEIRQRIGVPLASYEADRILVYSMIEDRSGRFQVIYNPTPVRALYHLVLVFGSTGTLEKHSLVRVQ
jgi:hypothetical protein